MTTKQITLVQETWLSVAAINPLLVGDLFYLRLFQLCPEVKPMFQHALPGQSKKLLYMLNYIITRLKNLEEIVAEIRNLARRHVRYGVKTEHYDAVGAALLWTLEQGLGSQWSGDAKEAWTACYETLASAMIDASVYTEPSL